MPIINRNLDVTERRFVIQENIGGPGTGIIPTGATIALGVVPMNAVVASVFAVVYGVSNTPIYSFGVYRFITGTTNAGYTFLALTGSSLTPAVFGTSGVAYAGPSVGIQSVTYLVSGQTLFAGDQIVVLTGGSGAAATSGTFGIVIQPTDDYVKWLGY
jgi:hypothetical protein